MTRRIGLRRALAAVVFAALPALAFAQSSASHRITESVFNNGGDPLQGNFAASLSHHVTLDSVGDPFFGGALSSPSYRLAGGFFSFNPPPGEVAALQFTSNTAFSWSPERSAGLYEVYRDPLSALPSGGTGACFASSVTGEAATDSSVPAPGAGWFYLVTVRNRLGEEGTKGHRSNGAERPNPLPCP
jgi:hypothetical protein